MCSRCRLPALFLCLAALVLVTACSHGGGESNARRGDVRVMLTADPASTTTTTLAASATPGTIGSTSTSGQFHDGSDTDIVSKLQNVNVTFSSLLARNLDGDLIDLVIDLPRTVDLIGLMNGKQVTLPMGTLPPGMYDQLVVVITHVEFVFVDGAKVDLTPPGGGWTKIVPVTPFTVVEGQTITIDLRFKPFEAFREMDGEFQFFPDFDCRSEQ
jgi:hypothetical protein